MLTYFMVDLALRAIAEPRRREILRLVQDAELSSGEIAAHFEVTRPATSQHLRILADAGLVSVRRQGTRRLYRTRPEGLAELRAFLESFWDERLALLARAAGEEEQRKKEGCPEMTSSGETGIIEREIRISALPETVFPFFTEPDRMVQWMGISATLEPRPGGVFRVSINGRGVARGEYVEVVPNSRVVFTWGWESEGNPIPPGSTTVEVSLVEDGGGTILRFRHLGLPAEQRDGHAEGWGHFLPRVAMVAEGGDPGPDPWASPDG